MKNAIKIMKKTLLILIFATLWISTGCTSLDYNEEIFHRWCYEDLKHAKGHFGTYSNILLVCIYKDYWEDQGPNKYSIHHYKGTVVKVYKGDWQISERLKFFKALDYPSLNTTNTNVGNLAFILTNQKTKKEIFIDTGEFIKYDKKLEPALDYLFPQKNKR